MMESWIREEHESVCLCSCLCSVLKALRASTRCSPQKLTPLQFSRHVGGISAEPQMIFGGISDAFYRNLAREVGIFIEVGFLFVFRYLGAMFDTFGQGYTCPPELAATARTQPFCVVGSNNKRPAATKMIFAHMCHSVRYGCLVRCPLG